MFRRSGSCLDVSSTPTFHREETRWSANQSPQTVTAFFNMCAVRIAYRSLLRTARSYGKACSQRALLVQSELPQLSRAMNRPLPARNDGHLFMNSRVACALAAREFRAAAVPSENRAQDTSTLLDDTFTAIRYLSTRSQGLAMLPSTTTEETPFEAGRVRAQATFRHVHRPHGHHEFSWDVKLCNDTPHTILTVLSSKRVVEGVSGKTLVTEDVKCAARVGNIEPGHFKDIPRAKVTLDCNLGRVYGSFTLGTSDGQLLEVHVPPVLLDGLGLEAQERERQLQLEGHDRVALPATHSVETESHLLV